LKLLKRNKMKQLSHLKLKRIF